MHVFTHIQTHIVFSYIDVDIYEDQEYACMCLYIYIYIYISKNDFNYVAYPFVKYILCCLKFLNVGIRVWYIHLEI